MDREVVAKSANVAKSPRWRGAALAIAVFTVVASALGVAHASPAAAPRFDSIKPATGGAAGGAKVVITGQDFSAVTAIRFGTTDAKLVSVRAGKITVIAPRHRAGLAAVHVVTRHGTSKLVRGSYYRYVSAPRIATRKLPTAIATQHYAATLSAVGKHSGRWTLAHGSLPRGLRLSGRTITGTPAAAGTSTFTVRVTDAYHQSATAMLTITVHAFSGWVPIRAPAPRDSLSPQGLALTKVACGSSGTCAAVGSYYRSNSDASAVLEVLSDSAWTASRAPLPSNADTIDPQPVIDAVSCAATSCFAVGTYTDNTPAGGSVGTTRGVIEALHGDKWTAIEAPLPASATDDPGVTLTSIACPTPGVCIAVGSDNYGGSGLVDMLSAGKWTATVPPATKAGDPPANLTSVACAAVGSCAAVGFDNGGTGLLEKLSGTSWTTTDVPLPGGAGMNPEPELSAVDCTSSNCIAVGTYSDTNGFHQGIVETLTSGSWVVRKAPLPAGAYTDPAVSVTALGCGRAGSCLATGLYTDKTGTLRVLLDTEIGGHWTATRSPLPKGQDPGNALGLPGAACPLVNRCIGVGDHTDVYGEQVAWTDVLAAGSFTAQPAPAPANFTDDLSSLACDARGTCVAVGYYELHPKGSSADSTLGLIETAPRG